MLLHRLKCRFVVHSPQLEVPIFRAVELSLPIGLYDFADTCTALRQHAALHNNHNHHHNHHSRFTQGNIRVALSVKLKRWP